MDCVYEEGGYITFRIEMDESLYSIDLLKKASAAELKKAMREELISNAGLQLYSELLAAKRCGCGFKYLYVGDKSGKTCSFQLEPSELPTIEELEQKINECLMFVR